LNRLCLAERAINVLQEDRTPAGSCVFSVAPVKLAAVCPNI